jgi:hypothetical protein
MELFADLQEDLVPTCQETPEISLIEDLDVLRSTQHDASHVNALIASKILSLRDRFALANPGGATYLPLRAACANVVFIRG